MKKALWGIVPTLVLGALITLKLCKVITWSWWWVLAPAWVPVVIVLIVAVVVFIVILREVANPGETFNGINLRK